MGIPLNGPNSHRDRVFVFAESSEDCLGEGEGGGWRARNGGRTGLRGLAAAFVQQVKWADNEKAAEKLILVQRDAALIRASGRKSWASQSGLRRCNLLLRPSTVCVVISDVSTHNNTRTPPQNE